jgi:hypothetical protein
MWHQTVMKQSGLVVTKGTTDEGAPVAEAEHTVAEEENIDEEEDYSILIPTKPSHLDFEKSTVSEADMPMMMKMGYFGEAERKLVRFAEEETTPAPKSDEVVVFKRFGVLKAIMIDNGTQFDAETFKTFCDQIGTKIHFASVRHPESNGLVE